MRPPRVSAGWELIGQAVRTSMRTGEAVDIAPIGVNSTY